MEKFLTSVAGREFAINEKGELKQTERNQLKADILQAFSEFLTENGVETFRVKDGLAIEITNEDVGAVPVVIDFTVKSLQFDVTGEHEIFMKEVAEKHAKAEAKAREKQAKIAQSKKNVK